MAATAPRPSVIDADAVVTGEAVVVELPVAGPALRMISGAIDVLLALVLLIGVSLSAGTLIEGLDAAAAAASFLLLAVGVLVALPTACETIWRGRTLGKKVMGLRSVREDGGTIDFRRALTRHLVGFVEIYLLGGTPALLSAVLTSPTRRLGDIAAGTYVTRERVNLVLPEPVEMPAHLREWAAGADIGRLPDSLVHQMRAAIGQGREFTPETARRIADELAHDVLGHVLPPPPAQTSSFDLIAAVLAERRRRARARLDEQARLRERLFGR